MISDGTHFGVKMDLNRKLLLEQEGKKLSKLFFVEKHNNKLPIWKIKIPSQIPSWKESASIKLKHFFAKNYQN